MEIFTSTETMVIKYGDVRKYKHKDIHTVGSEVSSFVGNSITMDGVHINARQTLIACVNSFD